MTDEGMGNKHQPTPAPPKTIFPTEDLTDKILNDEFKRLWDRLHDPEGPGAESQFDTRFATGNDSEQYWRCKGKLYRGNDINYIGIGMYDAWKGFTPGMSDFQTYAWKAIRYQTTPGSDVMTWLHIGYNQYQSMYYSNSPFPYNGSTVNAPPVLRINQ